MTRRGRYAESTKDAKRLESTKYSVTYEINRNAEIWKPPFAPLRCRTSRIRRKTIGNADSAPSEPGYSKLKNRGDGMDDYTKEELEEARKIVASVIGRCEKMHPKFMEGTSQHTLLKNRIKALYISKSLITGESVVNKYTKKELSDALRPVSSIISKCEKAQLKFAEDTFYHTRFKNIIKAMYISKSLITKALEE
jgi:hypothetical protein